MSRELIIDVNGFKIYVDSLYKIVHKVDKTAPSGYYEEGSTKLPSMGIGNTIQCDYISREGASTDGVWDTGFYEMSPCYSTTSPDKVKTQIQNLEKHIIAPYEKFKGKENLLSQNSPFWDTYMVQLYAGRVFDTSKADQLLDLYISLRTRQLTPKGGEGNPLFRDSQYCVVDLEKARSVKDERSNKMLEAISSFMMLLENDPSLLKGVLSYMGIATSEDLEPDVIKPLFYEWINADGGRTDEFERAVGLTKTAQGKDTIILFSLLRKALRSKLAVKTSEGNYACDGHILGGDLKTAAKNVASDPELEEVKILLLEQ